MPISANRNRIKREHKSHLSSVEIEELGIDLPPGHDHYRAYVGPPYLYDVIGALQFAFLCDLGLREHHTVLEVGCGSLRVGRLLINWLLPERYFGLEPNRKILEEGIESHFGAPIAQSDVVRHKKPRFDHNEDFNFTFTGGPVDIVFAQSIASHTGANETRKLLEAVAGVCHESSIAMITYIRTGNADQSNKKDGWFYPECVSYTDRFMADIAMELGLHAYVTNWPLCNRAEDGFFTGQTPMILSRSPWRPSIAQKLAGLSVESEIRRLC